jgi:hypothetical protein
MQLLKHVEALGAEVADPMQNAQLTEYPNEIDSPVSRANDGKVHDKLLILVHSNNNYHLFVSIAQS